MRELPISWLDCYVKSRTTERLLEMTRMAVLGFVVAMSVVPAPGDAADMTKVLRVVILGGETGFDPVRVSDVYSSTVTEQIYEPLLTYDYLARPAKLVPMTAEAMPQITDNGKTWLNSAAGKLPDSPERNRLYDQMSHQMEIDAVWRPGAHPIRNYIIRSEVKGYKKHPVLNSEIMYVDLVR